MFLLLLLSHFWKSVFDHLDKYFFPFG